MGIPATLSSVPAQTPYIQYIATSNQTVFPYPFEITQDSDLIVVINGVTQATDSGYSLSGVGNSTGGNLTFTSGRTTGDIVTLYRDIAIERISQIAQNSGFSSTTFNAEFNQIYLLLQQLAADITQCLRVPNTNSPAPVTGLTPAAYANKYLAFDGNGNPEPANLTSSGSLTGSILAGLLNTYNAQPVLPPNVRTTAETAANVVPVNYAYAPDHVGSDVRRYGSIDLTGLTDCQAVLNTANSVGVALYLPKGTYKISSNLTLSVPCVFESGAVLKPDANVTVTINAPIWAPPTQIFNISNSGAAIAGSVVPMNTAGRLYTEWFGAGQGGADDSALMQATAALAASSGYLSVQLLAKTYNITNTIYGSGSNSQLFDAVSWFGMGKRKTIIDSSGFLALKSMMIFRGGSGQMCNAVVEDICFTGSATNSYGLEFSGQCGMKAVRCKFDTLDVGVFWHNSDANAFTEYCTAENCEFTGNCVTKGYYKKEAGGATSFHGSGFTQRCTFQVGLNNAVYIDSGCEVYNAPLDVQCWCYTGTGVAWTLVNNQSGNSSSHHGAVTYEQDGQGVTFTGSVGGASSGTLTAALPNGTYNFVFSDSEQRTVTVATGTAASWSPALNAGSITTATAYSILTLGAGSAVCFAGTLNGDNEWALAGTFTQGTASIINSDSSVTLLGGRWAGQKACGTGQTILAGGLANQTSHRLMWVRLVNTAGTYDYRYLLDVDFTGAGGTANSIINSLSTNTAGYGAPTFQVNASGQLAVNNNGFPASGVTAYYSEQAIAPGPSGGKTEQV